jgi:glycosyltransferase involved in cell wall biosynthesis
MKFILYAQTCAYGNEQLSDVADLSGFSLLNAFSSILRDLGDITQIHHPEEAEPIYEQCLKDNEACLLLSFTPPHLTPITSSCPVVPVFTWEYADIPEQIEERCWLDDPRHDWRFVLAKTRGALVLSTHARDAIRRSMGPEYPVIAVNWPLSLRPRDLILPIPNADEGKILSIHASVGDSRQMGLNADIIACVGDEDDYTPPFDPADTAALAPFGSTTRSVYDDLAKNSVVAALDEPGLMPPPLCSWTLPPVTDIRTRLRGTVYTAVLSPSQEQDNWEDLVTGFCWSFGHTEDATLVLVVDDPIPATCQTRLVSLLTRLSPFKCRVLAIYGIPSADEYAALIRATAYCVNTSCASGSCRPVADFLAAGVPAIAPAHTGLSDIISADCAFVLRSVPGAPRVWPHGDQDVYRTSWHQIDWQSLVDAFRGSHALATGQPSAYLAMARSARQCALTHCSSSTIKTKIQHFLFDITASSPITQRERQQEPTMMIRV